MVRNPWCDLPDSGPDFILPQDAQGVQEINRRGRIIDPTLLPEPYLGSPHAPIVLLNLNPGWSPSDATWHAKPVFRDLNRSNLLHRPMDHPFYLLDPRIACAPGSVWWRARLRHLISAATLERVASGILCVERFPYHSKKFDPRMSVPSQRYSDFLVEQALQRGAFLLGMRGRKFWEAAIPNLAQAKVCWLNSPQATYVTPNNLPRKACFVDLIRRLN
jgi:hypothetical protein